MSQTFESSADALAAPEGLLDALFATAPVGLGFWDRDGRFVRVNETLAAIAGLPPAEHLGRTVREMLPELADEIEPVLARVLATGEGERRVELSGITPAQPGILRTWRVSYYPVRTVDGAMGVGAVVAEVTDLRRADQRTRLQHAVTHILAEAETVDAAIPLVLETLCSVAGWDVASFWPAEPEPPCVIWSRPELAGSTFVAVTRRLGLTPGTLPGRVAATGREEWVNDFAGSDFVRASVAAADGLTSAVAFPVLIGSELAGVIEVFSCERRTQDGELLESLAALGSQVGQFLRRRRAEEERMSLLQREQSARADAEAAAATLRKLERVTEAALQHLSLGDLLPELLERIVEVLEADTGSIVLVTDRDELVVRAAVGLDEFRERAVPIPMGKGLAGRVAATRETLLVPDLSQIELISPSLRERGINSIAAIPLIVEDEVIGVLHVGSEAYAQFVEEDTRLLQLMADRIAFAVNQVALHEAERAAQDRLGFLAEASALLGSSLDVERTLDQVGSLLAASFADWCAIHLLDESGAIRLVTVAHADPERRAAARAATQERTGPAGPATVRQVMATGEPLLWSRRDGDEAPPGSFEEEEGLHSGLIVPLVARSRPVGALSLVRGETPAPYSQDDLRFAGELAHRAAVAIDNAQLHRATEERAQAARVLASVGDGVFLVDHTGIVRTWNRAATLATGLEPDDVVDRRAAEAIPGWTAVADRIPVAVVGAVPAPAESLPLDVGGRELWLSIHGVAVQDGVVYAFRDLTEERGLETLRNEFVSTVSHELRTPLAAIYGAAMTLRRTDVALDEGQRARLLDVVSGEADRLARTVNDILWASRLDTDTLHVTIQACDPLALMSDVVAAQRAHLDEAHELELSADDALPLVAGDPDKVGRVLINLVDNAVKYSPDGGRVDVSVRAFGSNVRFSVADQGIGIPSSEQRRVFEKFYRLDPHMNRGVGGTGLGLYICRELVRRMDGRIWVESLGLGRGATFNVELPSLV